MPVYEYSFDEEAADKAAAEWGANCGPCALAFVARKHIDSIRGVIPGFDEKRYTSPTMMMQGCIALGLKYLRVEQHFHLQGRHLDLCMALDDDSLHLVRVQWTLDCKGCESQVGILAYALDGSLDGRP